MIRKLNRIIQDFLRPIRLWIGKIGWDIKERKYPYLIKGEKLNMDRVKSVIIMRTDGKIGDMVITSFLFREIKKKYPHIKLGLLSRGEATQIARFNPYIDKIYLYEKGQEKIIAKEIAKDGYDVLVDFSTMLRVYQMKLIYLSNAKINIGVEKYGWKLFDFSYKKDTQTHITNTYKNLLKIFDIDNPSLEYEIYSSEKIKKEIQNILNGWNNPKKLVVLNPYAASKHRSFNKNKIIEIAKKILVDVDNTLVIIGENSKEQEINSIIDELNSNRVFYPKLSGILAVSELISYASYVITPDTSIVHIGVAKKIPMTAVYRADTEDDINSKFWGPNSKNVKIIFSKDRALKKGDETDINMFEVEEIL